MRITAALCLALLPTLAAAQTSSAQTPSDRAAIRNVIAAQLDAFRHDDGAAAYRYASPHIRALFGDPATFLDMVRQGYPPVYRSRSASFGALDTEDGHLVQHVDLDGPDGDATALYTVEHEADGTWRIDGCQLVKSERIET